MLPTVSHNFEPHEHLRMCAHKHTVDNLIDRSNILPRISVKKCEEHQKEEAQKYILQR